jgi:cation:H+ antiporter
VSLSAASTALGQSNGGPINPDGPVAIAIANVVGSNICNIGLILGISLLIGASTIPPSTRRLDLPALVLATVGFIACVWPHGLGNPVIARVEAALLFLGLIIYITLAIRAGGAPAPEVVPTTTRPWWRIIGGLALLLIAGRLCLAGAVVLAAAAGLSERVIGLTVVAAGTSLPELFASLQAARKGYSEVAIANVIGSNLFNTLCILGITGMVIPLPVNQGTLSVDLWWMSAFLIVIIPGMIFRERIGRGHGIILIAGYIGYTIFLLTSTPGSVAAPVLPITP